MKKGLVFLALSISAMNVHANEELAKWEPFTRNLEGGIFRGPGVVYMNLGKCAVKIKLLSNETTPYVYDRNSGIRIDHRIKTKKESYTKNLGLGCYAGKDLADIKKDFTLPDGSYGLSETFRKWGEDNTAKIAVQLFKGANWQGVANVEYLYTSDHPGQYIDLCLFSDSTKIPQALCNGGPWNFTFKPKFKTDTFKYVTQILGRITFIDHDQIPLDSLAQPPKPVEPPPVVPFNFMQSE